MGVGQLCVIVTANLFASATTLIKPRPNLVNSLLSVAAQDALHAKRLRGLDFGGIGTSATSTNWNVWVYLDEADRLVWVEASSYGGYASMILEDGTLPCDGTHPIVYSQPGKHAFSPTPHWFTMFRDLVCQVASDYAGAEGVLIKEQYVRQIPDTPEINALVGNWLRRKAFTPTLNFSR